MSRNPLISIILPTYNGARYLDQAIQSCIRQTYSNWELIIVDDASKDNTPSIIGKYMAYDKRIRAFRHEINRKLPAALNTGFAQARGQYLTWTSDDNYYLPEALEEMIMFLQTHPETGIVYTDYSDIDSQGDLIKSHKVKPPARLVIGCIIGPSFLYRRQVYTKVGKYSEDMFLAEDYDFWLRACFDFRFSPLHKNMYCYRHHDDRLASRNKRKILYTTFLAKQKSIPRMTWMQKSLKCEAFLHMSQDALKLNKFWQALKYMIMAAYFSPSITSKHVIQKIVAFP